MLSKLQYISQGATNTSQLQNIQEALDAGCTWIQLRHKNAAQNDLLPLAEKVKKVCDTFHATLIINDHPLIAKEVDADGVHLGLTDINIAEARSLLGLQKVIGGTANTLQDILQRVDEGCNYIGLGPFRFTTTKQNLSPVLGVDGYKVIMDYLQEHNITTPVYAIGGILPEDVTTLKSTGIYGIAASGIITSHANKKKLITELNAHLS